MIIEGRHADIGTGVYINDIQAGSCSDEAGLAKGDLILAVNGEDFVGVSYSTAAKVLKNAQGTVKLIVANPKLTESAVAGNKEEKVEEPPESLEKPKVAPKP